jgi:hypothetical protein
MAIGGTLFLKAIREALMKLLLVTFLAMFLFIPSTAFPQVNCFSYGSGMGAPIISCDSPRGNTTQVPLTSSQGLLQSDRYGTEPYTLFPSERERSRDSYSSHPIEPLNRLDRLDRLDRRSDPLSDPLLPWCWGSNESGRLATCRR